MAFNWACPWCDRAQSVVDSNFEHSTENVKFYGASDGRMAVGTKSYLCANPDCKKTTIELSVRPLVFNRPDWEVDYSAAPKFREQVYPRGASKPQPDYIPEPLRVDYEEACLIRDLSPKASATLSRRCLQGMIRDYCQISRPRLIEEIKALRTAVDDGSAPRSVTLESVEAIDHVRNVGNIGAHMERNIDQIVEVDPDEAQLLIELIELLFREWYIERHVRQQRLEKISALGQLKDQQKEGVRSAAQVIVNDPDASHYVHASPPPR